MRRFATKIDRGIGLYPWVEVGLLSGKVTEMEVLACISASEEETQNALSVRSLVPLSIQPQNCGVE